MNKRILMGTRQYEVDSRSLLELNYYMIEKPKDSCESYYGIEVTQQKLGPQTKDATFYKSLLLSESKEWVQELINKFIGNGVTPSTMAYIIDDIMQISC